MSQEILAGDHSGGLLQAIEAIVLDSVRESIFEIAGERRSLNERVYIRVEQERAQIKITMTCAGAISERSVGTTSGGGPLRSSRSEWPSSRAPSSTISAGITRNENTSQSLSTVAGLQCANRVLEAVIHSWSECHHHRTLANCSH